MTQIFDQENIKPIILRSLDRYSKGHHLFITDEEVIESGVSREVIETITKNVFNKMTYNFLMYGDEKPAGIWEGSYNLDKAKKSIRERLKNI